MQRGLRSAVLAASTPWLRSGRTSGLVIVRSDRPSYPRTKIAKKKSATSIGIAARREQAGQSHRRPGGAGESV